MQYKYEYKTGEEREEILETNSNLFLIEERNITEGNFLIFTDAQPQDNESEQNLISRVSDISTYLSNSDSSTIADIENSILEIEKNKIINGGM